MPEDNMNNNQPKKPNKIVPIIIVLIFGAIIGYGIFSTIRDKSPSAPVSESDALEDSSSEIDDEKETVTTVSDKDVAETTNTTKQITTTTTTVQETTTTPVTTISPDVWQSAYEVVINEHSKALKNPNYDYDDIRLVIDDWADPSSLWYTYKDIDNNGIPELLISYGADSSGLCGLYAFNGNSAVLVEEGIYRSYLYLLEDGILYSGGSGGAATHYNEYFKIADDGYSKDVIDSFLHDYNYDTEEMEIFHRTDDEWIDKTNSRKITETEYEQLILKYASNFSESGVAIEQEGMNWTEILPIVSSSTNDPIIETDVFYGIVNTSGDNLNLRSEPSTNATIVTQIPNGYPLIIYGYNSEWYYVGFNSGDNWYYGYVHRDYIYTYDYWDYNDYNNALFYD